jgi:hypothetical protein
MVKILLAMIPQLLSFFLTPSLAGRQTNTPSPFHQSHPTSLLLLPLLRFYPIFVLGIQFFLIIMGIEFGPMLKCERQARRRHAHSKKGDFESAGQEITQHADGDEQERQNSVSHTRYDRLSFNSEAPLDVNASHAGAPELEPEVVPFPLTLLSPYSSPSSFFVCLSTP